MKIDRMGYIQIRREKIKTSFTTKPIRHRVFGIIPLGTTGRPKKHYMDGRNGETETRDHTSVDIDDEQATQQIVTAMKGKMRSVSRTSKHRCIYRVPKNLRDINEAAYVPRLVSLGPFHHGNANLKAMEEQKWRYFICFIEHNSIDLGALVRLMKGHERKARGFYGEFIALSSDQFVQVMLVDAIFVIHHLLETLYCCSTTRVISIYEEDFFGFQVLRDMLLLENQLPFFILEKILDFARKDLNERPSITELTRCYINSFFEKKEGDLTKKKKEEGETDLNERPSITELTRCYINRFFKKKEGDLAQKKKEEGETDLNERPSITELTRCYINSFFKKKEGDLTKKKTEESETDLNGYEVKHFVDYLSLFYMPEEGRRNCKDGGKLQRIKSMTELHKAGVRFEVASTKTLLKIHFEDGVLKIPQIDVIDSTETIFRNLLAYDQCHYGSWYISDYFVLMGMLIDTPDDVELLVKGKILKNQLATNQEVSKVFNNLEKEVLFYEEDFYYSDLCKNLNDYCDITWHKQMANLKQNYLDTPWKVISIIAASILLVLTVIQTVCSVISL